VLISWSGDNYSAGTGDNVGGVVLATGKTLEDVKEKFISAFDFHVEGCLADGDDLSEDIKTGAYEFEYTLQVSALLHSLDGILTRSALARVTGINERQLGHYATGHSTPRPAQREKIIKGIHRIGSDFVNVV